MGFSLPFFKKKSSNNTYFGLYLTDASAFGFVFDATTQPPQVLSQNAVSFTAGFDKILEDTDNLISQLELQTNKHLDKTIFFLHSWMIDEQSYEIKEPYKSIIKKLSKDLELEPMGYIDVQDALHEHLKKTSVLNSIAIEVNKTKVGISVYKGGKKVYQQYTARTDVIGEDIQSVLESIPGHIVLPTKILVFGDMDTPEVSSELATYDWEQKVFSQHPTIEVLKQNELNISLAQTFSEEVVSQSKVPAPAQERQESVVQNTQDFEDEPAEDFGFVVGQDVRNTTPPPIETSTVSPTVPSPSVVDNIMDGEASPKRGNVMDNIKGMIPSFSFGSGRSASKKPIMYGVAVAALLFILLFIYEYFFHKLDIKVYPNAQEVSETFSFDVPVTESDSTDLSVLKKTTVQEFEDEKKASGKREIGEKATGEVIIHNYDKEARTFPRGTELKKGDLVFTIDSEAKVASASGGTVDGVKESGKVKVKATAEEIGPEYNIAKGTQLSVASLSDSLFVAFVETAFSGGSKKDVTTISKADIDSLKKNVEAKAESASKEVLGAQISEDEIVMPDMTSVTLADTTFSGEIGEEASNLSVKAESEIEFYTIKKRALEEKLKEMIQEQLSDDFTVDSENITYEISDISSDEDTVTLEVDTTGKAHKKVDLEAIKKAARFTSLSGFQNKVKSAYDVENIEVKKTFAISLWTPLFQKNITVNTETE